MKTRRERQSRNFQSSRNPIIVKFNILNIEFFNINGGL
jgi:hypothetical protein